MRTEETIVNIIFDAGKGSVSISSREGVSGTAYGTLPTPTRRGYRFVGWYLGETPVTAETVVESDSDVRLHARWEKAAADRKASALKRQKIAVIALVAVALMLAIALAVVGRLITIYPLDDRYTVDGVEYTDRYWIKKVDGTYGLYRGDGTLAETNSAIGGNVYIASGSGNQYRIDPETGDYTKYAMVDTAGSEEIGFNNRVLLYPQIQQSYVYSIEVNNAYGKYTFYHAVDGVYIDGYRDSPVEYDATLYASLCTSCGFTLSNAKLDLTSEDSRAPLLENGKVNYAAYGLDQPQASFTITGVSILRDQNGKIVYNSKGNPEVEYDANGEYLPSKTQVYTVNVGDKTLSQDGYYVQLEGRDEVYVLSDTLEDTILQPIENLVTPRVVAPVSVNYHSMGRDFFLVRLDDWMGEDEVTITPANLIAAFDYVDLSYRINTLDTIFPYLCNMDLMDGYRIDTNSATDVFSAFYGMQYAGCRKLGFTGADLKEYGLDKDVYYLTYATMTGEKDENGNDLYVTNSMIISQKTPQGTHYVASPYYRMIVEIDQAYLTFLDREDHDWYYDYFMHTNIAYIKDLSIKMGNQAYDFHLDNSLTYAYYLTTKTSGGVKTETLTPIDLSKGTVYRQGNDLYYKISATSKVHKVEVIVDFDTVSYVSYAYARSNPNLENVIYIDESDVVYYRYRAGVETVLELDSTNLRISCDQYTGGDKDNEHLLDYSFSEIITGVGGNTSTKVITASENFSNFYLSMMFYTLEGDVDEEEFKKNKGMSPSDFLASGNAVPDATISYYAEDLAYFFNGSTYVDENGKVVRTYEENNSQYVVINFYRYTDWKAMITIETLEQDENGNWVSDGNVAGRFYVLSSFLEKLMGDAQKVVEEKIVDRTTKY